MSELLPCPFCLKGDATEASESEGDEVSYFIECLWCKARGPGSLSPADAIEAWNNRGSHILDGERPEESKR